MDLDSPDVMKDFPGLYSSEDKKYSNNSDFSDDPIKKESTGKKKDKKDKKDKDKGYAALEGESSAEESPKMRSPSKYKKTKSFKFTSSKSKDKPRDKRDKSKEKELCDKKKERDKKAEKWKIDKNKKIKSTDDNLTLADTLPIFGVSLQLSVERSRCHDGIDIPLPVRQCIDYLEAMGMNFEGIYKVSGTKSKVMQIKKMFNNRENVNLFDYDVPTSTSLLKLFLRELIEPIFTNDLIIRFEEAGAILNVNTREKHLKILLDNLPPLNKLLLSWIIIHLDNVSLNEKQNRMSRSNLGASLNHTLHISSRLLTALIFHSRALFPTVVIFPYVPPLSTGAILPKSAEEIEVELKKQESLLNQIHAEMNCGVVSKQREELLWEVQRIVTQLKRNLKICQKSKQVVVDKAVDKTVEKVDKPEEKVEETKPSDSETSQEKKIIESSLDSALSILKLKNNGLLQLRESLIRNLQAEHKEISTLQLQQPLSKVTAAPNVKNNENLDKIMDILKKENQILQIKKIHLVRQIIEQQEICINLRAKLEYYGQSRSF